MLLLVESQLIMVVLLSALVSSQQYVKAPPQYQVQDNGDRAHSPAAPVDYTAYLSAAPAKAQATEEKGFVEPIDFSGLFAGASSGVRALAPSSSTVKDFFTAANSDRDPFSLALGSATSQFPSEVEVLAEQNNASGFTNPQVKFQSLFDISGSGSASEIGFRPQDFLQPKKASEDEQSSEEADVYSPSYAGITSEYKPSYSKPAASASGYHGGSKDHTLYRASPSEERNVQSSENYNDQPKYTSSFAASPSKYHKNKYLSEVTPGKSSYPAPSSPAHYSSHETYKPLPSDVRPEKANTKDGSYGGYTSYEHPKNADYRSDASATQQGKSVYPSPVLAYGAKSSDDNASPNEKNAYASSPSELYKKFGIDTPQPSNVNTAVPQSPNAPSTSFGNYPSVSAKSGSYLPQATDYSNLPNEQGQIYEKRAETYPKEATATENQEKKCKRVQKHASADDIVKGRFRREAMTCFQCEDPKTKLNYEKCSYEPEPQGSNYFKGHTQSYKVNLARAPGFRFRRDLEKIVFDFEKEWDLETEKIYPRKVRQQSGPGYGYDYKGNYKYGPQYFGQYFGDKYTSPSEYVPSASEPDSKNCKKVEKDKMTCYECTDPKNGGTYEKCSYSAKPKEKNYFIAHETSFNKDTSNNKPKSERNRRGFASNGDGVGEASSRTTREEPSPEFGFKVEKSNTPVGTEDKSYSPSEFSAASENKETKKSGYDPYSYNGPDYYNSFKDKSPEGSGRVESYFEPGRSYDEYFKRLFPELSEAERASASTDDSEKYAKPANRYGPSTSSESKSQNLKSVPPGFFTNNESKKDLHKVFGDFSNKDWSSCKKVRKDKMTCYQCVDKNGLQHEECMFVAASEPKNQHLAYHEVKEFRLVPQANDNQSASATQSKASPPNDSISSQSNVSEETTSPTCTLASSKALPSTLTPTVNAKPKRKTFFKKVTTTTSAPTDSKVDETQRQLKKTKVRGRDSKSPTVNVRLTRRTSQSVTSTKSTSPTTAPPTTLLEEQPTGRLVRRKVTMSTSDMIESASTVNNKKHARPKSQAPLPSEPELSDRDRSPDGYYSAETRTRFDPVLKVTLPEYMLTRSEHEAIFDEVMASGHRD